MSTRSIDMHKLSAESRDKFDYFICGVAGALCAYLGQTYVPRKLDFGASSLEPLALVCLMMAFYLGLKRVEAGTVFQAMNTNLLDSAEKAGNLATALSATNSVGPYVNAEGGDIWDRQEMARRYQEHLQKREIAKRAMEIVQRKLGWLYKWRNGFL